jgi:hypothetical protein
MKNVKSKGCCGGKRLKIKELNKLRRIRTAKIKKDDKKI